MSKKKKPNKHVKPSLQRSAKGMSRKDLENQTKKTLKISTSTVQTKKNTKKNKVQKPEVKQNVKQEVESYEKSEINKEIPIKKEPNIQNTQKENQENDKDNKIKNETKNVIQKTKSGIKNTTEKVKNKIKPKTTNKKESKNKENDKGNKIKNETGNPIQKTKSSIKNTTEKMRSKHKENKKTTNKKEHTKMKGQIQRIQTYSLKPITKIKKVISFSKNMKVEQIVKEKTKQFNEEKLQQKKNKRKSNIMSRSALKTTKKTGVRKKLNHKEKRRRSLEQILCIRYIILGTFIVLSMGTLLIQLFRIQILSNEDYQSKVISLTEKTVYGDSAPRGRIYDRNHKLLVNNKPLKIIYYKKPAKVTTKKEMELAYKLIPMLSLNYDKVTDMNLRKFWILKHPDAANQKITQEERTKLEERKIKSTDIYNYKIERITEEDLGLLTEEDRKAAYLYSLMNKGYSYDEKEIKKYDVTDEEYAWISENLDELPGIGTKLDWEREYLYGDTFKSLIGSISTSESGIPVELKENYLKKGYSLNDRVGISYLEYQYEDILKGTKNKYKVLSDGTHQLIEEGSRGNDIVLTIDIDLQREVEQILTEELLNAKKEANTEHYNRSFVIIQDSKTGEILAMSGKQIQEVNGEYKVYDYSPGLVTSSVVVGSSVKGASHIVGYNNGALRIGEYRYDSCVKIAATPLKCSWTNLGNLNDVSALAQSSNTYQFYTAMKVGKANYRYDAALKIDPYAFDIYRNTFAEFGLGVKTEIDLPKEVTGYAGKSRQAGHLLDFSIGQYDNYTPIQLSQYITTIANDGNRLQPHLLKEVYNPTKDGLTSLQKKVEVNVLNRVNTESRYMARVKEGFRAVMTYGTGVGYIDYKYNAAGKTGTSESFVDTDKDGKVDTPTISNTFVAYAPFDNPKVTFTVISPDVSHRNTGSSYSSPVNKRITGRVTQKYFDIYG